METCPVCGYSDKPKGLMPSTIMSHYINKNNPKDRIIQNSADVEIIHKSKVEGRPDSVYIREDKYVTSNTPIVKIETPDLPGIKVDAFGNPIAQPKQP